LKISPHDPALILGKLSRIEFLARVNPLALTGAARVRSRWKRQESLIRHWTQIPEVAKHLNRRITGDAEMTFRDLVCKKYLSDGRNRRALSLGCGDGERERQWAALGAFTSILGLDLSPARIDLARRSTQEAGLSDVVKFEVADVNALTADTHGYDAIIFEHSLHHFSNIPNTLRKVHQLLQPGGLLIVDEFVGPRRFQWTHEQLEFTNATLSCLPIQYRRSTSGTTFKKRHLRAGELLMWLNDPSEAIESDQIEEELCRQFKVLFQAPYGGTISHLVFHDIAHNFVPSNADSAGWARKVLAVEDSLLKTGMLKSDFACYVCTN
jgi:ubiquinone/menaquinone biosynthesis C-methylase UbiE